jgi:hypothetical protein
MNDLCQLPTGVLGDGTFALVQFRARQTVNLPKAVAKGEADVVCDAGQVTDLDGTPDQMGQGPVSQVPDDAPDKLGVHALFPRSQSEFTGQPASPRTAEYSITARPVPSSCQNER